MISLLLYGWDTNCSSVMPLQSCEIRESIPSEMNFVHCVLNEKLTRIAMYLNIWLQLVALFWKVVEHWGRWFTGGRPSLGGRGGLWEFIAFIALPHFLLDFYFLSEAILTLNRPSQHWQAMSPLKHRPNQTLSLLFHHSIRKTTNMTSWIFQEVNVPSSNLEQTQGSCFKQC